MTSADEAAVIHALLDRCSIPRTGSDAEGEVTFELLERVEMLADRAPASVPVAGPLRERLGWLVHHRWIGKLVDRYGDLARQWATPFECLVDAERNRLLCHVELAFAEAERRIGKSLQQAGRELVLHSDPEDQARGAAYLTAGRDVLAGKHREPKEDG